MLDPAEACLDAEDTLRATLIDEIVQNDRVARVVATVRYISLIILVDLILFDVA